MRFLEEHVMVMAAAHRLVFASRSMMEVDLTDLVIEVAEGPAGDFRPAGGAIAGGGAAHRMRGGAGPGDCAGACTWR